MDFTTRKPQSRSRSRLPNSILSEKPSITVEKSFEISFDYSPIDLDRHLSNTMLSPEVNNTQSSLTPSTTYRAATSIGRPSTARDKSDPIANYRDPICPGPIVRTSQDKADGKIDVHEALRSQLPPLRQSKRWAKAYLNEPERPKTSTSSSTPQLGKSEMKSCELPQRSPITTAADAIGASDNESEPYGLCRPAHVPGWQAFRRHRLLKRHSVPTRALKSPTINGPKHMKSSRSMRARLYADSRRAVMPKAVQGKNAIPEEHEEFLPGISGRWRRHKRHNKSQQSSISALSEPFVECIEERSSSPVSSLHDYEKVTRFSQECVNMLSGLDFGDEWRVSVVAPSLSIRPRSSAGSIPAGSKLVRSEALDTRKDSLLSVSRHDGKSGLELFKQALQANCQNADNQGENSSACLQTVHGVSMPDRFKEPLICLASNANAESTDYFPAEMPVITNKSSKSSFNRQILRKIPGELKPARSVDTLTEIEAQVGEVSTSSTHQLERKGSTFTLNSSPKRQRPCGQPPERPLPDLPKDDASDARSTLHRHPSFASSSRSRFVRDALEISDPFGMSSVQTIVHLPSVPAKQLEATRTGLIEQRDKDFIHNEHSVAHSRHICNTTSSEGILKCPDAVKEDITAVTDNVPKKCSNGRNLMTSARLDASSQTQFRSGARIRSVSSSQILGKSNGVEPSDLQVISNHNPSNLTTSRTLPELHFRGTFAPLPPGTVKSRFLHVAPNPRNSQELARTLSKCDSAPSRKFQVRQKKLKQVASSPNLQQSSQRAEKPKQILGRSQIMVIVDTNPHTASFRAGALSPSPSLMNSRSRPTSPAHHDVKTESSSVGTPKQLLPKRIPHEHTSSAEFDNLAELIDIVKPPASVQKKRSLRELRVQTSARNLLANIVRNTSNCASPTLASSRTYIKPGFHRVLDSSDSELEDSPLIKTDQPVSTPSKRTVPRTSIRKSHMRKDTPLTTALKEEVKKADLELENLKKYEQRIEYLQLHLDQTLKVWNRMSQNGKKQYLASTFGNFDRKRSTNTKSRSTDNDMASIAASSTYSRRSSVQRLDDAVSRSLKEALDFTRNDPMQFRRTSGTSSSATRTGTGTDTDTDGSIDTQTRANALGKRISGGSLTDPQDYDIPPSASSSRTSTFNIDVAKTTKSESLGANLNDFRARLQATRPPTIPARRCKPRTPPQSSSLRTKEKDRAVPCPDRYSIAPWEKQDGGVLGYGDASGNSNDSHDRLSLERETLRTDQMDALLIL